MDISEDSPSINYDDSSSLLTSIAESVVSHGYEDKEVNDIDLRDLDDDIYRSLLRITKIDESVEMDVENEIDEETINVGKGNTRVTVL